MMMASHVRNKVLDLFSLLRHMDRDEALHRFAQVPVEADADQRGIPYGPMLRLKTYARCRAWALQLRREGQHRQARHEAAKAGKEAKYFRSL